MIDLPEGYSVRPGPAGVDFVDEAGQVVLQDPSDGDLQRRLVHLYKHMRDERLQAIEQRRHYLAMADALDRRWKISEKYR